MYHREVKYGKIFVLLLLTKIDQLAAQGLGDYSTGVVTKRLCWYELPYVWVGAAFVFLGFLIFIIRRNERI